MLEFKRKWLGKLFYLFYYIFIDKYCDFNTVNKKGKKEENNVIGNLSYNRKIYRIK